MTTGDTIEAKLIEANLYAEQGLYDEAIALYNALLVEVDPLNSMLRDTVTSRLAAIQPSTEAGAAILMTPTPSQPALGPEKTIEAKLAEADLYAEQGLHDEALALYNALLVKVDPQNAILRDKVTERLATVHSPPIAHVAAPATQASNTPAPATEESLFENCLGLMVAGFYAEANDELRVLLHSGFRPAAVLARLGECCLQLDRPFEAIEHFEKGRKAVGRIGKTERLQLLDLLAITYERTGSVSQAIKIMEEMATVDPSFHEVRKRLTALSQTTTKYGQFYGLIRNSLLTPVQLDDAKKKARQLNKSLDKVLLNDFGVEKRQLGQSLAEYYECPFAEFSDTEIPEPPPCLQGVKENYFRTNLFVPIRQDGNTVVVLVDNPNDPGKQNHIRSLLHGASFRFAVGLREDINHFIDFFYGKLNLPGPAQDVFERIELVEENHDQQEDEETGLASTAEGVVVDMANRIIEDAVARNASDIHIETLPGKRGTVVRFRIDGACSLYKNIPHAYKRSLISRLKILAKLDISERRLPQDGKIKLRTSRGGIELRVASLPTHGGNEDMVLRILSSGAALPIDKMGLSPRNLSELRRLLDLPYGLILVVGPTGSGKTTTLHGALNHVNRPDKKIWTVEDPVEILQDGLRQVQIEPKIGLDFARVLRSFLRADPDIIMVGETRDQETAEIVIEAALTGHLVFSTLHTNSALETVTRLLGMGVDPFNFADSLLGVLAQRLVRRLCPHCREAYQPDTTEKELLIAEYGHHPIVPLTMAELDGLVLHQAKGCDRCKQAGYQGRLAIHELLTVTDPLKLMIVKNNPVGELRDEAMAAGMLTLKQDGIRKVLGGHTDLQQVRAACIK